MTRKRRPHAWLATTVVVALAAVSACTSSPSSDTRQETTQVRNAADQLTHAMTKKDLSSITFADSDSADRKFKKLIKPLHSAQLSAKASGNPKIDNDRARNKIAMKWRFPGTKKLWSYTVTATWKRTGKSGKGHHWRPVWKPSLVQPDLSTGAKLTVDREQRQRGKILGAGDKALITKRPVVRVGIDKSKLSDHEAASSAKKLARLVDVNAKNYVKTVKSADKQEFVEAIMFREKDPDLPSESKIDKIRGAIGLDDHAMLGPSKSFGQPILGTVGQATREQVSKSKGGIRPSDRTGQSGLQARYDDRLRGTPSIKVRVIPPKKAASPSSSPSPSGQPSTGAPRRPRTVYTSKGTSGKNVTTTLDAKRQRLAETAVGKLKPASSLVAIRPSTGAVVAAATNSAGKGQNLATSGQVPPGSTFKIIDALALIRAGVKLSDEVKCPAKVTVNGRKFSNYSGYPSSKLGKIDFRTSFANSCNTAFIGMRNKVDSDDLNQAAASLGAATSYDVGFPAYFGSIPQPKSQTERGAEMIGQGRVQMSPLALASVTASVRNGKTVLPQMVKGKKAKPKGKPLTRSEAKQLTKLMGSVVDEGSGTTLKSLEPPKVIAKTGTAEYGNAKPPKTHAWMVGAQDDLAVAVFVDKGDSGAGIAGPALKKFLHKS